MSGFNIVGDYVIQNGASIPVGEIIHPRDVKQQVYEVLRVIDGKPLFWEDHFERLRNSLSLIEWNGLISMDSFKKQLLDLIQINKKPIGNIRIDLFIGDGEDTFRFAFIPHKYPAESDYKIGVPVGLFYGERHNPHIKAVQSSLRDRANAMIAEENLFEVLLVDLEGFVEEGSRTNVFFIKKDKIYTPLASKVLLGITRMKVLECIKNLDIPCEEAEIHSDLLADYDAVFLTGTSPKVLPISTIAGLRFDVENPVLRKLMKKYDTYIENYLSAF